MGKPIAGEHGQPDFGTKYKFRTIVSWGQIIVDLEIIEGETDLFSLRNVARDCVDSIVDLMSYASGCRLQTEIISAVCRDTDDWQIFGVEIPVLATSNNPFRKKTLDADLIIAIAGNAYAAMVYAIFIKQWTIR
jgi:hypothetical protein